MPRPVKASAYATVPPCTARTGRSSVEAISMPFLTALPPSRPSAWPNRLPIRPVVGHSSAPRNGSSGTATASPTALGGCELLLDPVVGHLQLAHVLRGEVAPRVDLRHPGRARRDGAFRLGRGPGGLPLRVPGAREPAARTRVRSCAKRHRACADVRSIRFWLMLASAAIARAARANSRTSRAPNSRRAYPLRPRL